MFEGEVVTYGALNARADVLASALQNVGVTPERLVALCMARTPDLVAGMLAILKAGGAYVPLEPGYPRARLATMLADCQPSAILTDAHSCDIAREASTELLRAPAIVSATDAERAAPNVTREVARSNLAYVMYTSGSTGRPKGVMVEHRHVVNLMVDMAARLNLAPGAVAPAIAPVTFDIAGLELLLPLSAGQSILLLSRAESRDPFVLAARLDRDDLAFVQATPSTWRGLMDAGWRARGAPILCGGEALAPTLARRLVDSGAVVWNVYGPTETTIWSSAARITDEHVTIGRPVANTHLHVLDGRLALVAPGAVGEICIGGDGVARGYRNRPGLTAEKFVADPFSGGRLYRTGDLGRVTGSGEIEFLGRRDLQVKIRGARVELGEVEALLAQDTAVAQAVVAAQPDPAGSQRLAAFYVPAGAPPPAAALRARLAERMPDHMIPDVFVPLARLPLTAHGKIDRQALATWHGSLRASEAAGANQIEERLEGIWSDLLGVRPIGRDESFFDLGGNSLMMIGVAAKIHEMLGVQISLQEFFATPTLAGLSAQVVTGGELEAARPHM